MSQEVLKFGTGPIIKRDDDKLIYEINNTDILSISNTDCVLGVTGGIDITGDYKVNGTSIGISMTNIGITGGNIFNQLNNVTYELKGIIAGDNITLTEDEQNIILDVALEAPVDHTSLLNIGTNSHLQIDNHIASTSNPHNVTLEQLQPFGVKGDLLSFNGIGYVNVPIGITGEVLTVDLATDTCLKWTSASATSAHADLIGVSGVSTYNHTQIDSHINSNSNPHNVTLDQITPTTTKGDILVEDNTPQMVKFPIGVSGQVLTVDNSTSTCLKWMSLGSVTGAGETNTMSNIGITGTDIFYQKTGVDFELRGLLSGDHINLVQDNQNITISVDDSTIDHTELLNIGTNTHTQIDSHIASTSNPHSVTIDQITPTTTQGDLLVENGTNVIAFPLGTTGQVLTVDTSTSSGLKWDEIGDIFDIGEDNTGSNIGITGSNVFFQKSGVDFEFKGLIAGDNIWFQDDNQNITINSIDTVIDTTASNIGITSSDLFYQKSGSDLQFRGLLAGDNITLIQDDQNITITANDDKTTASNIGITGFNIYSQETGHNLEFKGLIEGTNIELIEDAQNITINSTVNDTTASNIGVTADGDLYSQEIADDLQFKGLFAGANIGITQNNEQIWITGGQSGEFNTMSNIGITGSDIFFQKDGVDFELRGLVAGDNITLIQDNQNITITANDDKTTASNIGVTGFNIYSQETGHNLEFKGLIEGTNIELTEDAQNITINAIDNTTVSNVGITGSDLFYQEVGDNLQFRGLIAGDNITLIQDNQNITITANDDNTTASNLGITADGDLYSQEIADDLQFKGLFAGANIGITQNNEQIWITGGQSGEFNTMSNIGITGSDIFFQKDGVDFELRGLLGGDNITLIQDNQNIIISSIDTGEVNTASNIGITGSDIFFQKSGVDFEFRGLIGGDHIELIQDDQNVTVKFDSPTTTFGDLIVDDGTDIQRFGLGTTGQFLTVDTSKVTGLRWVDASAMGEDNTASNIGITGADIFFQKSGVDLEFRGLLGGDCVDLVEDDQNITINVNKDIAIIRDEKVEGTEGGTFSTGAWRERDLNTLEQSGTFVTSLSGNEFTLVAGKYLLEATVPAYAVDNHKSRLYNVSDSIVQVYGTAAFALDSGSAETTTNSEIKAYINITSSKSFRIEHRCENTKASNGFGLATGWGDEIYTNLTITKLE